MKFIADHMLGTLAKWLRLLGYDTIYPETKEDADLLETARNNGRILLTKDKEIVKRRASREVRVILVKSDDIHKQLGEVFAILNLKLDQSTILTRCSVCNTPISEICRESVKGAVPDSIFKRHERFWKCSGCGRHYWEGSHWERIMKTAKQYSIES